MTRRALRTAFCLTIAVAAAACHRPPVEAAGTRTLDDFQPMLNRRLTHLHARVAFGAPNEETGSGLRIYIYYLRGGSRLWLGFPGDAPIVYARVRAPDGSSTDVPLPP